MILKIYLFRDVKMDAFMAPMFFANKGVMMRDISEFLRRGGDQSMQKYPGDFELYESGEFDSDSGEFTVRKPDFLFRVSDLVTSN